MLSPAYETPMAHQDCERGEPRTNLFVLANLVAQGVTNRVKVRNISASGALIEAPVLPRQGVAISLCRGDVVLTGRVVWSLENRAGIRFDGRAVVADWLPSTMSAQREVDRVVALAKAERLAGHIPPTVAPTPCEQSSRSASDLVAIAALLDQLANELAGDITVVCKFSNKLQILDIAGQALKGCAAKYRA